MFEPPRFEAEIKRVAVVVKSGARLCKLSFERELDNALAEEIGPDARRACKALETHGLSEVVIPIDAIAGKLRLTAATGEVDITSVTGTKAKCRAGKADNEDDPPKIRFEFVFPWQPDAWTFLGANCIGLCEVLFTPAQTTIPFPKAVEREKPAEKKARGKRAAVKEASA